MSSLPSEFVNRMLGLVATPTPPPLPAFKPSVLTAKQRELIRGPVPTPRAIYEVDKALREEGVYLNPETLRQHIAETNSAVHEAWKRGDF